MWTKSESYLGLNIFIGVTLLKAVILEQKIKVAPI